MWEFIQVFLVVILSATGAMCIAIYLEENKRQIKKFFSIRYKIVNKNEGIRPFHLYRRTIIGLWRWVDSYREFSHAREDVIAIRNRRIRGWHPTTTYLNVEGNDVES